ncbi:MAG: Orotidine 5'-phosphate decarboxylase [Candidatus Roizmanbacteria bacterium GW2011_GWA2_35_19]|uniref:Orotidine-5'-phosphate decarboxylase n=2 Tax=Candidatus Roizmaniibacteriota TaxID=1752723 RepID=A0A0G0BUR1_9BACT|nr:MAG: Orotidine 5'-phosphate decarboxylase [Candidatus Roizmanbacteria bacterium GW2011_GWC2_35_12]KKP73068.1 MAG: Orotidine 5'-phosphate decarboxylase [Candidatus Roizmanbacteria bacterium GW2011_GWA2_35_19]
MNFNKKLEKAIKKNNSLLCVGLDSDVDRLRESFGESRQFLFNKSIIEATKTHVCSYKLNTAFYEAIGHSGIKALKDTCDYLREKHPEIPLIIDAKRGDIGNTNDGYVQFVFTYLGGDAVTINPYFGEEAIRPFLNKKDKGIIVLCKTSNAGAGEIQDLVISNGMRDLVPTLRRDAYNASLDFSASPRNDMKLYQYIAYQVSHEWNKNKNCLLVVGAMYPNELKQVRKIVGQDMTLLIPGIGAQGGDLEATLKAGLNSRGRGLIINSSRNIVFAKNPREEAKKLRVEINKFC